jgi:CheY-like chemotaxis protein
MGIEDDICDTAFNGQQAVQKVKNNPRAYNLILMDCNMPIMDGCEATLAIREFLYSCNVP